MTLYEIDNRIMNCFRDEETDEVIDTYTGEIFDGDYLDQLAMEKADKVENVALYIKNLEAEAEAVKAEKMRFAKRQQALENRVEYLKKYLSNSLQGEKFSTTKCAISFRKSEKLEIAEDAELPPFFVKIEKKPMAAEIKKAIKGGTDIPGCTIVISNNIQIK